MPAALATGLLLVPLAACGGGTGLDQSFDTTRAAVRPGASGSGVTPSPTTGGSDQERNVSCTDKSCSLELSTDQPEADAFGSRFSLDGIESGRARVTVGDAQVACTQGEAVTVARLDLTCTQVSADRVTLTAEVR